MLKKALKRYVAKIASLSLLFGLFTPFLNVEAMGPEGLTNPEATSTLEVRMNIEGHFQIRRVDTDNEIIISDSATRGYDFVDGYYVQSVELPATGAYFLDYLHVDGYEEPTSAGVGFIGSGALVIENGIYVEQTAELVVGVNIPQGRYDVFRIDNGGQIAVEETIGNDPGYFFEDGYYRHSHTLPATGSYFVRYYEVGGYQTPISDAVGFTEPDITLEEFGDYVMNPPEDANETSVTKTAWVYVNDATGLPEAVNYQIDVTRTNELVPGPLDVNVYDTFADLPVRGSMTENGVTLTVPEGTVVCGGDLCADQGLEDLTHAANGVDITLDNLGDSYSFFYTADVVNIDNLPSNEMAVFTNTVTITHQEDEGDVENTDSATVQLEVPDIGETADQLTLDKSSEVFDDDLDGEADRIVYSVLAERIDGPGTGDLDVTLSDSIADTAGVLESNGATATLIPGSVRCNGAPCGAIGDITAGAINFTLAAEASMEVTYELAVDLAGLTEGMQAEFVNTAFSLSEFGEEDEDEEVVVIPEDSDQLTLDKSSEVFDDDLDGEADRIVYSVLAERIDGPGTGDLDVTLSDSIADTAGVLESNGATATLIPGSVRCNGAPCGAIGDITLGAINFTLAAEASMEVTYELAVDLAGLTEGMQAEFVNTAFSLSEFDEEDEDEEVVVIPEPDTPFTINKEILNQVSFADGNRTATYRVILSANAANAGNVNVTVSDSFSNGTPAGTLSVNGATMTVNQSTVTCNGSDCTADENITLTDVELTMAPDDEFIWIYTASSNNNGLAANNVATFQNVAVAAFDEGTVEDSISINVTNPSTPPSSGCPPNCGNPGGGGGGGGGSSYQFDRELNVYLLKEIATNNLFYDRSNPANPHPLAANDITTVTHQVYVVNDSSLSVEEVEISVDFDPGNSGHTAGQVMNVQGANWDASTETFSISRIAANDDHIFTYETDITTQSNTQASNHYVTLEDYTSSLGVGITNFGTITRQNLGMQYDSFMAVDTEVQQDADTGLIVTAQADRNEARHGECILVTITAENAGVDELTGVTLIHDVDPSLEINNTFGGNNNGDYVTWLVGDLEPGGLVNRQVSLCVRNTAPIGSEAIDYTRAMLDQYPYNNQIETVIRIIGDEILPESLPITGLGTKISLLTALMGAFLYIMTGNRRYAALKRKALRPL